MSTHGYRWWQHGLIDLAIKKMLVPVHRVIVREFECAQCHHKWINRINGVDGSIPKKCAKCKRKNWNQRLTTPKEIGLRKRVRYLKTLYFDQGNHWWCDIPWDEELADKFLNLDPRPSRTELEEVLSTPSLKLNSQNQRRRLGYVPDPRRLGRMIYDKERFKKLLKDGAEKQQELMRSIIASRSPLDKLRRTNWIRINPTFIKLK